MTHAEKRQWGFADDLYALHRLALQPLLPQANEQILIDSCQGIRHIGESCFLDFLHDHFLAPTWSDKLTQTHSNVPVSEYFITALHQSRISAAGCYLLQKQALQEIRKLLESAHIKHVVFKGCHIRELIYKDPALRVASDIDVLVSDDDRLKAMQILLEAGYKSALAPNISHEINLNKNNIAIDLHWNIMRPGRTRMAMTGIFLHTGKDYSSHWGSCNEATLFLMLVHPVFTKYSTTPYAFLIRMLDLALWLNKREHDWELLCRWLSDSGMRTAAWITLEWLRQLTDLEPHKTFSKAIQPSYWKILYFRNWLRQNLSSKLLQYPFLIKAGFTLPAHDKLSDAAHAVMSLQQEKKAANNKIMQLAALKPGGK